MKLSRSMAAATVGVLAVIGVVTALAAPVFNDASATEQDPAPQYEEHYYTGSSTAARAFQVWFDGGEFVEPHVQTMDLRELRVNDTQIARGGDTIYKDENGDFWIKEEAKTE